MGSGGCRTYQIANRSRRTLRGARTKSKWRNTGIYKGDVLVEVIGTGCKGIYTGVHPLYCLKKRMTHTATADLSNARRKAEWGSAYGLLVYRTRRRMKLKIPLADQGRPQILYMVISLRWRWHWRCDECYIPWSSCSGKTTWLMTDRGSHFMTL